MHCSKFGFSLKVAIVFISSSWALAGRAAAQSPAELPVVQPIAEAPPRRNAIRFDVGGILASNFAYNIFRTRPEFLFPVLASYERSVGRHSSVVMEGLLNGGEPAQRKAGLSLQGRYYFFPRQTRTALTGFYVAPSIGYRSVLFSGYYYQRESRRHFVGGGISVGGQAMLPHQYRIVIDVSLGVMSWQRLGPAALYYQPRTYYEKDVVTADGRLGIGFCF